MLSDLDIIMKRQSEQKKWNLWRAKKNSHTHSLTNVLTISFSVEFFFQISKYL